MTLEKSSIWKEIKKIIEEGFSPEGLLKLEKYAELFDEGEIIYKRFSQAEQYGCRKGGYAHVIATLLSGAEVAASEIIEGNIPDFQTEFELAKKQIEAIKNWAVKSNLWIDNVDETLNSSLGSIIAQGGEVDVYDNGTSVIKSIGLDYFIQSIYALDRYALCPGRQSDRKNTEFLIHELWPSPPYRGTRPHIFSSLIPFNGKITVNCLFCQGHR